MITLKTGTWANVNGERMYLTYIDDKYIKGMRYDGERGATLHFHEIPLKKVQSATRSRRPQNLPKKLVPNNTIPFGQIVWDETRNQIAAIRFVENNRLKVVS